MKRLVSIFMVLSTLLVAGFAGAQEYSVKVTAIQKAFTVDLANTDWFPSDNAPNVTSVGITLYNLDTAATFDSFMRVSTEFDIDNMFGSDSHYGFTYGATAKLGQNLYGYGGLGFVSDFAHSEDLRGSATYGVLYSGKKVVLGFGDDTNAGATVSLGGKF